MANDVSRETSEQRPFSRCSHRPRVLSGSSVSLSEDLKRGAVAHSALRHHTQVSQFPRIPAVLVRIFGRFGNDHHSPDFQELCATLSCHGRGTEGSRGHQVKGLHVFGHPGGFLDPSGDHGAVVWCAFPLKYFPEEIRPLDHGIGENCDAAPTIEEEQSGKSTTTP